MKWFGWVFSLSAIAIALWFLFVAIVSCVLVSGICYLIYAIANWLSGA